MSSKVKVKCPIGIRWKIAKKKLQKKRNSINGYLERGSFKIPGTEIEYDILIYPNGYDDEQRGETWIYLHLYFQGKKEIDAEFSVSIESAFFTEEVKDVYERSDEGVGIFICTTDELFHPENQFIVDEEMTITVEGFLMIEKDASAKLCNLGNNKNELCIILWNQQNKDFTIVADGKEIQAHKCVLSGRSTVFEAMFQPHTKEAQDGKVIIPDFSFNVVQIAIKFCYDHSLVKTVSFKDQMSLLQFFDKYDMNSLKNQLEKHLITEINETNVCLLANSSIISNASNLRSKCFEFFLKCMKTTAVNDFDLLDKDFAFDLLKKTLIHFAD